MQETYEVCKILVNTEAFYKENAQHMMVTAIDFYTQKQVASVEFDYNKVFEREDKYKDIVGFYHTHPAGCVTMSKTDISTMVQWVKCLGKALVCLIECENRLYSWIFYKDEAGEISYKDIKATTNNDVNYNLFLEHSSGFWNSADFLLTEMEEVSEVELLDEMFNSLNNIETTLATMANGLNTIGEGMQSMADSIKNLAEIQKVILDELIEGSTDERA